MPVDSIKLEKNKTINTSKLYLIIEPEHFNELKNIRVYRVYADSFSKTQKLLHLIAEVKLH
jgi:ribosomal protein S26